MDTQLDVDTGLYSRVDTQLEMDKQLEVDTLLYFRVHTQLDWTQNKRWTHSWTGLARRQIYRKPSTALDSWLDAVSLGLVTV